MGKRKENTEKYTGVYAEIADIVGAENVEKIYQVFRGQEVIFPTRLYSSDYIVDLGIRQGPDSLRDIAIKYCYNEKYLKRLVKQKMRQ